MAPSTGKRRAVSILPGPGGNPSATQHTLWNKLQESYHKPDPLVANFSSFGGASYFWFTALSELWLLVQHALPTVFSDCSEMGLYYLRVLSWFIFLQTIANWLCAFFLRSSLKVTDDNPTIEQVTCDPSAVHIVGKDYNQNSEGSYGENEIPAKYCSECGQWQPYRCHHCPLCQKCILKRDHHCFFTGTCIGFYNQRFFIILNFYIILASVWGIYVFYHYLPLVYMSQSWMPYVPPISVWMWYQGELPFAALIAIIQLNTLWWTGMASIGFFTWHMCYVVPRGKTSHEASSGANVRSTASVSDNFKSVFGVLWPVNFIFPAVIVFKQSGNGKHWNNLKYSK